MKRSIFNSTLAAVIAVAGASQGPIFAEKPRPDGEQVLNEKYHTPLSREALLPALLDQDPSIRVAAAAKLTAQFQNDVDVIAALRSSLDRESIHGVRIALARDLGAMGDPRGIAILRGMCNDSKSSSLDRMVAAQTIDLLGRDDCLPEVFRVLRAPDDPQSSTIALNSLYHHEQMTAVQIQELRELVPAFLTGMHNGVERFYAAGVLGRFGDVNSARELREALATELDDVARKAMSDATSRLEKKFE